MNPNTDGLNVFLSRLLKVRQVGDDRWEACCPAHDDSDPSLRVAITPDGVILLKCFAGCSWHEIVDAVAMQGSDFFPNGRLGEIRGFMTGKERQSIGFLTDQRVLEIAKEDRAAGKPLSPQDLKREREAYLRIRRANAKR